MKLIFSLFIVLSLASCSAQKPGLKINKEDIWNWIATWKGELVYKDSADTWNIESSVQISMAETDNQFVIKDQYPGKYKYPVSVDTLTITKNGSVKEGKLVEIWKSKTSKAIRFAIEKQTIYNGKKATIKSIYDFDRNNFVLRKEIKYKGEYKFNRLSDFQGDRMAF